MAGLTVMDMIFSIGVYIVAFMFGITVGSFLNVCILRLPKGESLIKRNSHCMTCGEPIKPRDLIPILSWILLKGKCRGCGSKISPRYLFVEALTGLMFALTFMNRDLITDGLIYGAFICVFIAFLIVIGFEDFDTKEMSGVVLLYLGGFAALVRLLCEILPLISERRIIRGKDIPSLEDCLIGVTAVSVPFLIFGFIITPWVYNTFIDEDRKKARAIRKKIKAKPTASALKNLKKQLEKLEPIINEKEPVYGFGMGDIILMACAGLMLGYKAVIIAAFAAIVFGAICAAAVIAKNKKSENAVRDLPFGPFLCAGLAFSVFFGERLFDLYASGLSLEFPEVVEYPERILTMF